MTNNVDTTPISTKRARLQFTIMELLLFVALTFLGMAVVVPRVDRPPKEIVCALVLVATALGAALGLARSTPESPRRKLWLVLGVCFGGLLTAWATCVAMILADGIPLAAVTFAMIGLPVAIALWLLFFRVRKFFTASLLGSFVILYSSAVVVVPTMFLRTRCGCSTETAAAAACKAYAEAQEIYHRTDYSGTGLQYATTLHTLLGSSGELALVDKTFARAEIGAPGMSPRAGYYFKVLTAQGSHATGGQRSYIDATGKMTLGYAFIAMPAAWDVTGRDSFIINHNGTIFQQDLGPDTPFLAAGMTEFDPDTNWVPTQ